MDQWPHVYRLLHLEGGRIVRNDAVSHEVKIEPLITRRQHVLHIANFNELFSCVKSLGLRIIGASFYSMPSQIKGIDAPFWRPFYPDNKRQWIVEDCLQMWAQLAYAASKKDDFHFFELARRINFQITACSWEIRTIAEAYHLQLNSKCHDEYKNGLRFEAMNSDFIYMAVHSFLSSLGTLRDYLAEYVARYHYNNKQVTSIKGLMKLVNSAPKHDVGDEFLKITDVHTGGWMAIFSAYRDIVIHQVPISQVSGRGMLYTKSLLTKQVELPGIYFPLPRDPLNIKKKRSNGAFYNSFKEWQDYTVSYKPTVQDEDALLYCHAVFEKMINLLLFIIEKAPYKPEIPVFDKTNIIGPITVKHS